MENHEEPASDSTYGECQSLPEGTVMKNLSWLIGQGVIAETRFLEEKSCLVMFREFEGHIFSVTSQPYFPHTGKYSWLVRIVTSLQSRPDNGYSLSCEYYKWWQNLYNQQAVPHNRLVEDLEVPEVSANEVGEMATLDGDHLTSRHQCVVLAPRLSRVSRRALCM